MNTPLSFYDDLCIAEDATHEQIQRAFRQAALRHHPDRGGDQVDFERTRRAYETLKDPSLRSIYDAALRKIRAEGAAQPAAKYPPPPRPPPPPDSQQRTTRPTSPGGSSSTSSPHASPPSPPPQQPRAQTGRPTRQASARPAIGTGAAVTLVVAILNYLCYWYSPDAWLDVWTARAWSFGAFWITQVIGVALICQWIKPKDTRWKFLKVVVGGSVFLAAATFGARYAPGELLEGVRESFERQARVAAARDEAQREQEADRQEVISLVNAAREAVKRQDFHVADAQFTEAARFPRFKQAVTEEQRNLYTKHTVTAPSNGWSDEVTLNVEQASFGIYADGPIALDNDGQQLRATSGATSFSAFMPGLMSVDHFGEDRGSTMQRHRSAHFRFQSLESGSIQVHVYQLTRPDLSIKLRSPFSNRFAEGTIVIGEVSRSIQEDSPPAALRDQAQHKVETDTGEAVALVDAPKDLVKTQGFQKSVAGAAAMSGSGEWTEGGSSGRATIEASATIAPVNDQPTNGAEVVQADPGEQEDDGEKGPQTVQDDFAGVLLHYPTSWRSETCEAPTRILLCTPSTRPSNGGRQLSVWADSYQDLPPKLDRLVEDHYLSWLRKYDTGARFSQFARVKVGGLNAVRVDGTFTQEGVKYQLRMTCFLNHGRLVVLKVAAPEAEFQEWAAEVMPVVDSLRSY